MRPTTGDGLFERRAAQLVFAALSERSRFRYRTTFIELTAVIAIDKYWPCGMFHVAITGARNVLFSHYCCGFSRWVSSCLMFIVRSFA